MTYEDAVTPHELQTWRQKEGPRSGPSNAAVAVPAAAMAWAADEDARAMPREVHRMGLKHNLQEPRFGRLNDRDMRYSI